MLAIIAILLFLILLALSPVIGVVALVLFGAFWELRDWYLHPLKSLGELIGGSVLLYLGCRFFFGSGVDDGVKELWHVIHVQISPYLQPWLRAA
jgi:hypothetical protein